ncbi:addiction module toxin RelE [Pseudoduganella sp. FT26W]|uniref:Addiction module toxin RelE n=1 Tax=Duganella aquatilis TaxID=2666082 RepID=A0A844CXL8_9BURK|nr:transposase [Duganella aquatilis]MRW84638.1 addiction module toxin RelE [Duganella aquatilis]
MTRPLRLEFPGALYHVTSRGDRKALIYMDDIDRSVWLQTLGDVCAQFRFAIHSFCQMGNHYHLLVETLDGRLALGMRQLNGVYSQYFNRRHNLAGHVFQGRYKAILVDRESYLLELARYIVLNPVRAKLVAEPGDWLWSSYNLTLAEAPPPAWLHTNWLLSRFGDRKQNAKDAYRQFVLDGVGVASPLTKTFQQTVLGSEQFIAQLQSATSAIALAGISRAQRSALAPTLNECQLMYPNRDDAMAFAYSTRAYTLTEIAHHFGVSHATASRAAKKRG